MSQKGHFLPFTEWSASWLGDGHIKKNECPQLPWNCRRHIASTTELMVPGILPLRHSQRDSCEIARSTPSLGDDLELEKPLPKPTDAMGPPLVSWFQTCLIRPTNWEIWHFLLIRSDTNHSITDFCYVTLMNLTFRVYLIKCTPIYCFAIEH